MTAGSVYYKSNLSYTLNLSKLVPIREIMYAYHFTKIENILIIESNGQ